MAGFHTLCKNFEKWLFSHFGRILSFSSRLFIAASQRKSQTMQKRVLYKMGYANGDYNNFK
jgi:hypothetical protein